MTRGILFRGSSEGLLHHHQVAPYRHVRHLLLVRGILVSEHHDLISSGYVLNTMHTHTAENQIKLQDINTGAGLCNSV